MSILERIGKLFPRFRESMRHVPLPTFTGNPSSLSVSSRQQIRPCDVFNERKIACLLAIFVKHWRQIIQQTCAKNRDHARVWIEDRLARSVRAGVTQRDRRNTDLLSPEQDEPLLIDFRQTVNGFTADRRVFRCGNAFCDRAANRAMHLPIAVAQLFDRSDAWKDQSVLRTFARAFAVNGLRAGNDDFFDR